MFIYHQIMLFTITSFLESKFITFKILSYKLIEFIIYAPHTVEVCPNGLHSRHSLALLFYYARISCKQINHWNLFNSECHTLMKYEHNKILLQGNGCVKFGII